MALSDLISVVSPPEIPFNIGSRAIWNREQSDFGHRFPLDYRELVRLYGTGVFFDYLFIRTPARGIVKWARKQIQTVKSYLDAIDQQDLFPYPLYPEPGGLFPVGQEENGSYVIHWQMLGEPDEWPIVVLLYGDDVDSWEHSGNLTSFLARVFRGDFPCAGICPQTPIDVPFRAVQSYDYE